MKLESIVVGMDFSETAIHSAVWVARCIAPKADITLVHAIDLPARPRFIPSSMPKRAEIGAAAREDAQSHIENVVALLSDHSVACEVRVGKPHEELVKVACERKADIILIGPHGDRPRPRTMLGTTADRIIRTSPVSVLVGMNLPVSAPTHLLVPVEDAPITPAVLSTARSLAERFRAAITLLNVWSNAEYSFVASVARATAASDAEARKEVERDLKVAARGWLEEMAKAGMSHEQVRSLRHVFRTESLSATELLTAVGVSLIAAAGIETEKCIRRTLARSRS
jgi:nucleotide-binding universal stress UspA family protein